MEFTTFLANSNIFAVSGTIIALLSLLLSVISFLRDIRAYHSSVDKNIKPINQELERINLEQMDSIIAGLTHEPPDRETMLTAEVTVRKLVNLLDKKKQAQILSKLNEGTERSRADYIINLLTGGKIENS